MKKSTSKIKYMYIFITDIRLFLKLKPIALLFVGMIEDAFEYLRVRIRKYLYLRFDAFG